MPLLQVHEALHFSPQNEGQRMGREFGIWSIKWSGDGREIIAGTNDEVGRTASVVTPLGSFITLDVGEKVARVVGGGGREMIAGTNGEVGRGINLQHLVGQVSSVFKVEQKYECVVVMERRWEGDYGGHGQRGWEGHELSSLLRRVRHLGVEWIWI